MTSRNFQSPAQTADQTSGSEELEDDEDDDSDDESEDDEEEEGEATTLSDVNRQIIDLFQSIPLPP